MLDNSSALYCDSIYVISTYKFNLALTSKELVYINKIIDKNEK